MALSVLKDIRRIYAGLNPAGIRSAADQELKIGLQASTEEGFQSLERFFGSRRNTRRIDKSASGSSTFDLILCEAGLSVLPNGHTFDPGDAEALADRIVGAHPDIELALARTFPRFRKAVSGKIIQRVSRENALFSLVTALPNVVPSVIDLPWAVGEFATDTAFLTMNQMRMALLLAAAHGRPVGYGIQKMQLAAIAGAAFGWRALARELVGKIPLGGGLIPKAAVAFAGTWVVGMGLQKVNSNGSGLSRDEKRDAYIQALAKGRETARELAPSLARK